MQQRRPLRRRVRRVVTVMGSTGSASLIGGDIESIFIRDEAGVRINDAVRQILRVKARLGVCSGRFGMRMSR